MTTTTIILTAAAPLTMAAVIGVGLYLTRKARDADRLETWKAATKTPKRPKLSTLYGPHSEWGMRVFMERQAARDAARRAA
jgi:hypothetical protein